MARAAIKHVREQQRVQWEYYQDCWDLYPSIDQAMQRITNLGEQGWELVAITMPPAVSMDGYPGPHRKMAIFKRASYFTVSTDHGGRQ